MSLFYIGILKNGSKPAHELCVEKDLSSYSRFTREKLDIPQDATKDYQLNCGLYSYGEFMSVFSRTVAERTRPGERQDIEEKSYTFHAYGHSDGIAGIIISSTDYPALAAHQLLTKVVEDFRTLHKKEKYANSTPTLAFPELRKDYLTKYQKPEEVDSIMKIQKELDETKIVLHKTIESVLERGEKIDDLVQKSDGLSAQSKMFYKQAKKQNSCCVLM